MRMFDGAAGLMAVAVGASALTMSALSAYVAQPAPDDLADAFPAATDDDDNGEVDNDTLCPGDGDAIDTEAEIEEFDTYDSDTYYVLDDDTDCDDDEEIAQTGYSLPAYPQVRDPGILPLLALGRRHSGDGRPLAALTAQERRFPIRMAALAPLAPVATPDAPDTPTPIRSVPRSLGGLRVNDAEVPWQAQLFQPWTLTQLNQWGVDRGGKSLWEFQHLCGAALVANNWVLSAAHCLPPDAASTGYRVRLGAETIHNDSGYTYRIDRVVPFSTSAGPASNGTWRIHDIVLIHFTDDEGIGMPPRNQARPIPIDRGPVMEDDDPVYATGWGRVSNGRNAPTSTLMKVQLNIVANDRCARGPWGPNFTHSLVICAAAPGRQTCQGDSGGPLVNYRGTPRLIGVVSWNNADCIGDAGKQGIYTRVASYAAWIDRITGR